MTCGRQSQSHRHETLGLWPVAHDCDLNVSPRRLASNPPAPLFLTSLVAHAATKGSVLQGTPLSVEGRVSCP